MGLIRRPRDRGRRSLRIAAILLVEGVFALAILSWMGWPPKRIADALSQLPPPSQWLVFKPSSTKEATPRTAATESPARRAGRLSAQTRPAGGGRVVHQHISAARRRARRPASHGKPPEPVARFLAEIAREPSPCADLLATINTRIEAPNADLNALFTKLQRCKWKRPTYGEEEVNLTLFRHGWPDPWPEEPAIRKVIGAMAKRVRPPEGATVYDVPLAPPPLIDGVLDDEWNKALVFAPDGSRGRVFVMSDGNFLYLGVAVPAGSGSHGYDEAMVMLNSHLSPAFANEYFLIYQYGRASPGYRANLIKPQDAPAATDWREIQKLPGNVRWKALPVIYDGGIFPAPRAGTVVQGDTRTYEAAIDLSSLGIPPGHPFALELQVDATIADGKQRISIWPFERDYATHGARWGVWLRVPTQSR